MNRLQKQNRWLVLALIGVLATVSGLVTWTNGFAVSTWGLPTSDGRFRADYREATLYGHFICGQMTTRNDGFGPDDWWYLTGYLVGGILSMGYASGLVWFVGRLWRPAPGDDAG